MSHPRLALVVQPVLDLRRRPDHRAELASQLLLGETVSVHGRGARGWVRVQSLEDGYRGWVRDWGLAGATAGRIRGWLSHARHVVRAPLAMVSEGRESLGPLPWMARVRVVGRRGRHALLELPDGRRGRVAASAVAPRGERVPRLAGRVASLLGVPYLWGGRTVLGLDCSGLIQLVMAERGVRLPRDADEQWRACLPLPAGAAPRAGDLLFFSSRPRGRMEHVGILLGQGRFVHARGVVRINSMDERNKQYDNILCRQFRAVGRPPAGLRGGRPAPSNGLWS